MGFGDGRHRGAGCGQPGRGHWITLGPAMRGWRPAGYRSADGVGQVAVGAGPRLRNGRHPLLLVPPGLAAGETADPRQLRIVGRKRPGRLDDRVIGQDAPRRQVRGLGDLVPDGPELAYRGQRAAGLDPVDARGAAPWVWPGRGGLGGELCRELLTGPFG